MVERVPIAASRLAAAVLLTIACAQAVAQDGGVASAQIQEQQCPASEPDLSISGCTAMIQSGHETRQKLPIDLYNRGLAYLLDGQYDRAIEDFNQAIRLNPNYAVAFVSRGAAYSAKNQYDRAIEDLDQAIRLNPNDAIAFNGRGHAHFSKGLAACRPASLPPCALAIAQSDRAIEDFDQAIRLNPNYPMAAWAYSERSIVKLFKGDSVGAAADLAKAQQLSSSIGK